MVRVALEMVLTSVDMLGNDIPKGTIKHSRNGVLERLSSCSGCGSSSKARAVEQGACELRLSTPQAFRQYEA